MASNWQEDAEDTWTLRGDEGEILAAVTKHDGTWRTSGLLAEDIADFPTLEETREAVQRRQEQRLAED